MTSKTPKDAVHEEGKPVLLDCSRLHKDCKFTTYSLSDMQKHLYGHVMEKYDAARRSAQGPRTRRS